MGKILAILAVLCAVLVVTVVSDRPLPPAELTIIQTVDPVTLDPQRMSYNHDLRLSYAVFETLVRWDNYSESFGVVPAAAERWEVSPDRRVYTFHIDPEARWSNGDPVTAHDFIYAWRRAMLPDTASYYTALFFAIDGAEDFFRWRTDQLEAYGARAMSDRTPAAARAMRDELNERFDRTVGLRAVDDKTLEVRLARPVAYFLDTVAFGVFSPVHPKTVERFVSVDPVTGAIRQAQGWTKPPDFVTNGPYMVADWRFKREMRLVRNPHFRDPALAKSDSISLVYIEDMNTSVLAFESGVADWHADVQVEYIGDMLAERDSGDRDNIWSFSTFGTYFWSFNCRPMLNDGRPNPFHDPRVRRAVAAAIDKDLIVRKVRRSSEKAADVLVPPGSIAGFASPEGVRHDPARARRELEEAGWIDRDGDGVPENERGERFPVVELLCSAVGPHKDVALAMGGMLERVLGIRTKVVVKETKVYRDDLNRQDYMMARGGWYGDYLDPMTFLSLHRTGDGNNTRAFSDPYFDELLEQSELETDLDKRMRLLEEAERHTMDDMVPVVPIWHYDQYYLYRPAQDERGRPNPGGLRGISTHPRLIQYFWALEVVSEAEAEAWGEAQRRSARATERAR